MVAAWMQALDYCDRKDVANIDEYIKIEEKESQVDRERAE